MAKQNEAGAPVPGATSTSGSPSASASQSQGSAESQDGASKKTKTVILRHKTEHQVYRRAGLVIRKEPGEFQATAEQLAILTDDPWVEVVTK